MPNNRWISLANDFPYAEKLSSGWLDVDRSQDGYWTEYEKALDAYLDSRDGRRPLPARYACLTDSRDRFQALYDQGDTDLAVCLGLLRTQYELGNHQASMDLIRSIVESKSRRSEADEISIDRPFLSPHPDYDHRAVRDGLNSWLDAALSHARQQCTAKAAPAVSSRSLAVKAHWTLTIADGVRVCVPATVKSMTSYVLLEQEDWFEAELPFLRSLIEPGMGVLDIGANHGVYALSLAKRLQGRGLVIACEPASAPSSLLERSIIENGLQETLSLWRVGLSDHEGEAELVIHANSELHSLSAGAVSGQTETVRLTTLDALMDAPEWLPGRQVDIVKLDASGEESRILQGGRRFFAEQDPLVLCSIRVDAASDMAQLDTLRDLGMDLYRLVPGLNALAPVVEGEAFDRFQINLFACKPSRAKRLEMAGFLVGAAEAAAPPVRTWPQALASLPFVTALYADGRAPDVWQAIDRTGDRYWSAYEQALNAYLSACDVGQPVSLRQGWLKLSRERLDELNAEGDEHLATVLLRLRVLAAVGARNAAVEANARLVQALETDSRLLETDLPARLDRPFLPPLTDYDQHAPQGSLGAWLQAAILENLEIGRAYSTYFESDKHILQALADNPNRSLAMDRRRALLALVNGKQVQLTSDSPLRGPTSMPMHQNVAWWQRISVPEQSMTNAVKERRISVANQNVPRNSKYGSLLNIKKIGFYPKVVIDVGAQVGTNELYLAFPDAKHLLIEPIEEHKEALLAIARQLPDAEIIVAAASNTDGEATINVSKNYMYASLDDKLTEATGNENDFSKRRVLKKTLDSICSERDLSGPYLLKIDVDGLELDVLRGAVKILNETEFLIIECPLFHHIQQILDFMRAMDFVIYDIVDMLYRPYDHALWQVDIVFVKRGGFFLKSKEWDTQENLVALMTGETQQKITKPSEKSHSIDLNALKILKIRECFEKHGYDAGIKMLRQEIKKTPLKSKSRAFLFQNFFNALQPACEFETISEFGDIWEQVRNLDPSVLPFFFLNLLNYAHDKKSNLKLVEAFNAWGKYVEDAAEPIHDGSFSHLRGIWPKINLGIIGSAFINNNVSKFLLPVLREMNDKNFKITYFSSINRMKDPVQDELINLVDEFVDVSSLSHQDTAKVIFSKKIMFLIDTDGFARWSKTPALAYKPAPLQATWMNFPSTFGMKSIDYIIGAKEYLEMVPDDFLIEKKLFLNFPLINYPNDIPISADCPHKKNNYITFGSLCSPYKFTPKLIDAWAKIINKTPKSKLILFHPEYRNKQIEKNIREHLKKSTISDDSVFFIDNHSENISHFRCYDNIDIALDSFPLSSGTVSVDAAWMGVPVVTLCGNNVHERIFFSILARLKLNELVAYSLSDYIKKALLMANNPNRIQWYKKNLRKMLTEEFGNAKLSCDDFENTIKAELSNLYK